MVNVGDKVYYWFVGRRIDPDGPRPAEVISGIVIEIAEDGETVTLAHAGGTRRLGVKYSLQPRPGYWSLLDTMTPEQQAAWLEEFEGIGA